MLEILKEQPKQTNLYMCPGLFVKHMVFAEGTYIPQHSHDTDHLSVIATGSVRVWQDGVLMGVYEAPAGVLIEAHSKHVFLALQPDTTVLCVHAVGEDGEPPVHDESNHEDVAQCL